MKIFSGQNPTTLHWRRNSGKNCQILNGISPDMITIHFKARKSAMIPTNLRPSLLSFMSVTRGMRYRNLFGRFLMHNTASQRKTLPGHLSRRPCGSDSPSARSSHLATATVPYVADRTPAVLRQAAFTPQKRIRSQLTAGIRSCPWGQRSS